MDKNNTNPPEYTEREKDMRINALEAGAILEAAHHQLTNTQLEFTRIVHNIDVVIGNMEKAIDKLTTGGASND